MLPPIVLASASAVRLTQLRASGFAVVARPVDVDEAALPHEAVEDCVTRLALAKLAACPSVEDEIVIACDTLGDVDGDLLGKPPTPDAAVTLLTRLQGRTVRFVTGCALRTPGGTAQRTGQAAVRLTPMSADEITAYVATGEPLRAAGGIDVRGRGAAFVEHIEGDLGGAIGISPHLVWQMLAELGVALEHRWARP